MQKQTIRLVNKVLQNQQKFLFSQKVLGLFGAPGVGKGTYAKILKNDLGYNHISTGDEIRKILKGDVPATFDKALIEEIKDIVTSGGLVGDDIVINILKEKLKEPESAKGVILDGVPRTLGQLELQDKAGIKTDLVVNLFLNQSVLLEKLMARRVCDNCGENYNICHIDRDGYLMEPLNPKVEGVCDKCGGNLIIRADDKEDVITNRMEEYEEKTAPLLNAYQERGIVLDFEPKMGKKSYPELLELLQEKL